MIRKKLVGLVVIALFLLATAGAASAASLDLPKWVIVPEDSTFSDVTLFCPLDAYDATNNVTVCFQQGAQFNATIYNAENVSIVTGRILNAFDFKEGAYVQTDFDWNESRSLSVFAFFRVDSLPGHYWNDIVYLVGNRLSVKSDSTLRFSLAFDDESNLQEGVSVELRRTYAVLWTVDNTNKVTRLVLWDAETKEKLFDKSWSFAGKSVRSYTGDARISDLAGYGLNGMIDEVRIYEGKVLSDEEVTLLLEAGRKKLSEPANFRQIFSPMIDVTRDRATFYAGLEVSTSDPNGYVPVPESAVNMSITSAEKLKSDYTGAPFYYQGHYWYRADKIQFNLPIQFETVREKGSFDKVIILDEDEKTYVYEKEFKVTNPTATKINVLYTVDPTTLGFSVLQYPQFELDGVPMAEWRPSNSTNLYLIRTDSLEPGEISTHWMKSIWTITKEELEFPAKLDDFRSITTFEQARKLAENAAEGKTDTYVKVIKIDSNADVNNVTILVPLNVEDENDVIEAVALTGSRETLQVEKLEDGKVVVKVPADAFVSGHAEIKLLYNKEGASGISGLIAKIKALIYGILKRLGLIGIIWPVVHAYGG